MKKIHIPQQILKDSDVVEISFEKKIGDWVNKFTHGPDRIGQIIVKGRNSVESEKKALQIREKIKIVVENKI